MTSNQIDWLKNDEQARHNQVTEAQVNVQNDIAKQNADTAARQAAVSEAQVKLERRDLNRKVKDSKSQRKLNKAQTKQLKASAKLSRAQTGLAKKQAGVVTYNAQTERKKAEAAGTSAEASVISANAAQRQAGAAETNAATNALAVEYNKEIQDAANLIKEKQWQTQDKQVNSQVARNITGMITDLVGTYGTLKANLAKAGADKAKRKKYNAQASRETQNIINDRRAILVKELEAKVKQGKLSVDKYNAIVNTFDTVSKIFHRRRSDAINAIGSIGKFKNLGKLLKIK